ncbi:MAG: S-layer homology domain-containing protein [Oscillospiraceae bacterium]|nr:S-layer homology domain-containing protein [Oscillospiraceae bacterium]
MRNLKKTLCLVLALVFVLGLCTVGAAGESAAKFSDAESIQYKTQVDAMTGLGILIGYPDGTFKPLQNVTRAEAAKMISYMMVGTEEVEKWPAKQVFNDVPADHWAAKYITFCEYNDVINGYGDGNFGPSDNVTRAQLAKMLLAACGYGKKGELVGEGWDQNAARLAFECDVLKDIKTTDDWNSAATREETALMVFNTMMRTYRVVLGDDVDDYVPAWVNGEYDVTFAESPWGMITFTGIIFNNKANTKNAKGTTIKDSLGRAYTVETAADDDASVLGHEVTVVFRVEGVEPYAKNVAYLVIDDCVEIGGSAANYNATADYAVTVARGTVTRGLSALYPTKGNRAYDFGHKYIVNADNIIVGWKTIDGFTIVPVSINPYTGVAKVRPVDELVDQEVVLPAGVKQGDLVCLFKCGEIYTIQPTSKVENVAITQKQANVLNDIQIWSYNYGEVWPTEAENVTMINLASLTCMNPQEIMRLSSDTDPMVKRYEPVLKVGYSYTLYFDCFGNAFAYGDERPTNEVAASYYLFLCDFDAHDVWHVGHRYAQVMKPDGTIEKVLTTVDEGTPLGYTRGDIVQIIPLGYRSAVVKASDDVTEVRQPYQIADVQYDFGNATYCQYGWYNPATGLWNDLDPNDQTAVEDARADLVYRGSASRPKIPGAEVSIVFKVVKIGTAYIRVVDTVWFMEAGASSLFTKGSFIYVLNDDIYQQKWIDKTVNFYNGLKDGEVMDDLRLFGDNIKAPIIGKYLGFNSYYKIGDDYVLAPVAESDGTTDGVRSIYLVDADTQFLDIPDNNYCFYVQRPSDVMGKLWVMDANNFRNGIDVSAVKFVRLAGYSYADMLAGYTYKMPLDSIDAIQTFLRSQMKGADGNTYTFKLDITFVEKIDPITRIHSIDGNTIYITGISIATINGVRVDAAE